MNSFSVRGRIFTGNGELAVMFFCSAIANKGFLFCWAINSIITGLGWEYNFFILNFYFEFLFIIWHRAGNINSDPCFVTVGSDYYYIDDDSPCLDEGLNSAIDEDYDLDGNTRIVDGDEDEDPLVDMGAYEYQL